MGKRSAAIGGCLMPKILDYSKPRCPGCMSTLLSAHPRNDNVVHCNTCDLVSHVNKLVYLKREERKKPGGTGVKVGPRYVPETEPIHRDFFAHRDLALRGPR